MNKRVLKVIVPCVVVIIGACAITVSMKAKQQNSEEKVFQDAKEVGIMEVKKEKVSTNYELSGTLQPIEEVVASLNKGSMP